MTQTSFPSIVNNRKTHWKLECKCGAVDKDGVSVKHASIQDSQCLWGQAHRRTLRQVRWNRLERSERAQDIPGFDDWTWKRISTVKTSFLGTLHQPVFQRDAQDLQSLQRLYREFRITIPLAYELAASFMLKLSCFETVQLVTHVELPEWRRTNPSPEDELAIKG
ncbi:hypothetical protein SeMB42_g03930 [Synchytrium endobioticum]|uniref:Uncharacterized protein n=1 Tax=Synchytrium endobioticum TaxID=286115 RepID=A0A507D2W3_9FUNG|nr:hypothetical protein SeMB42_g03930 [Synchytrium endobioticum]